MKYDLLLLRNTSYKGCGEYLKAIVEIYAEIILHLLFSIKRLFLRVVTKLPSSSLKWKIKSFTQAFKMSISPSPKPQIFDFFFDREVLLIAFHSQFQ
jgi:hypothetical protein